MAENNSCRGECIKCSFQQQVYCAAQHGHAIMNNQRAIVERLDQIEKAIASLAAPQPLINPMEDNAQEDPGAENRGRKK